ncbi:hypothetical protein ACNOYE_00235 [Nannocystaceae bacterium ST9]
MSALWFGALGACVSQPSNESRERSSEAPERAPRRSPHAECAAIPDDARLVIEHGECPIVLVFAEPPTAAPADPEAEPSGRWVALLQVPRKSAPGPGEPIAIGPAPLACGPELATCELSGVVDERHGPILVAAERGYESEHPIQVHLGLHDAGKLAFVPSWYGESSVVDHTRIGPVFALAPFDCGGELRLLPAARLPEAAGETVPARLVMLAGRWWIGDRGQSMPPQIPDPSHEGCTPLLEPLP